MVSWGFSPEEPGFWRIGVCPKSCFRVNTLRFKGIPVYPTSFKKFLRHKEILGPHELWQIEITLLPHPWAKVDAHGTLKKQIVHFLISHPTAKTRGDARKPINFKMDSGRMVMFCIPVLLYKNNL
jgi:hypothetical protein